MLGLIGKSFIGERMFAVIAPNGRTFTLNDWLEYQDKVSHGTETEKNQISFKMLDISNKDWINLERYEDFCKNFVLMYGQMFNYKVEIDEAFSSQCATAFNVIA